jgi:hypothetical protein
MQMDVSQIGQWFGTPSGVRDEMLLVMPVLHVTTISEPPGWSGVGVADSLPPLMLEVSQIRQR